MQVHKPTILLANGTMNAGGTETLLMEMFRHQTGRVRYILMIHDQGEPKVGIYDDEINSWGVEVLHIPSVGTIGIKGYCKKFKEIVSNTGQIDIVHSHLNANGGIICMAAKQAGIKQRICHCHADIRYKGSWFSNLKSELELQVLRVFIDLFANHFWACSERAWHRLFYPWRKIVVIPNMIDVQKYLSKPGDKDDAKIAIDLKGKFIVGSIGRVARIKNYELALAAVALLNQNNHETHYVCYGRFDAENDAYCAELLSLADRLGISNKVHFMGNTTNVAHDIKAFDVFLMPSTTEGFGMAAIESQAAGIPTLLSNGVPKIVDTGVKLVRFVAKNDPQTWADSIIDICNIDIPGNDLILRQFNQMKYNSATMVQNIEDLYLSMLNK